MKTSRMNLMLSASAVALSLALVGCGGGGGPQSASKGGGNNDDRTSAPTVTDTPTSNSDRGGSTVNTASPTSTGRAEAIRSAIEAASTPSPAFADGAPGRVTIARGTTDGPDIAIVSNDAGQGVGSGNARRSTASDDHASYSMAGSAPVAPTTVRFSGYRLTRARQVSYGDPPQTVAVPESAYVWTDIEPPSAKPFTEV